MKFKGLCRITAFSLLAVPGWQTILAADFTTEVNTTVATSTANAGATDDVRITSTGSIVITDAANSPGLLVDSDNDVRIEFGGFISMEDLNDVTGIRILGNRQSNIYINGVVNLIEDYERTDTDNDGDLDGPLSIGMNRIGILLDGAGPLQGDIRLDGFSSLFVEGSDSVGIQLQSDLVGNLVNDGSIYVYGADGRLIDVWGNISGDLIQSGSLTSQGENSLGIYLRDGLGGALVNEASITTTGFHSTFLSNYADPDSIGSGDTPISGRIDAEALRPNGSGIVVGGSLGGGFLNNGAVDLFVSAADQADTTKDTIEDYDENRGTGNINSIGAAPALLITPDNAGSDIGDLIVSRLVEHVRDTRDDDEDQDFSEIIATFNYDYGLINRGRIYANGLNVGFDATGIRLAGTADGSRRVLIEGGIQNLVELHAEAYEADAIALDIGAFAETDLIYNQGLIEAQVNTDTANTATAIAIAPNARVDTINNVGGVISALVRATDSGGTAIAIDDASGTLSSILNQGNISARINYFDSEQPELGSAIALDLSSHGAAQGVSLIQSRQTAVEDVNGDGTVDVNDVVTPSLLGDVLLGAGDDSLDIQAGSVLSSLIDFGAGTDALVVANDASVSATLSGLESLQVNSALLIDRSSAPLTLNQLGLTGDAEMRLRIDSASATLLAPRIDVAGNATIESGASIRTVFEGPLVANLDLHLVRAGSLTFGSGTDQPTVFLPAIYQASESLTATDFVINLSTDGTAAALGLVANELAAFDAVLALGSSESSVGTALASYYNPEELVAAYETVLPDYSDSSWRYLSSEFSLAGGALASRLEKASRGDAGGWFDFSTSNFDQDVNEQGGGYSGGGVSLQMGLDTEWNDQTAVGLALGLRNGHGDPNRALDQRSDWTGYDLGLYGTYRGDNLSWFVSTNAGRLTARSRRQVELGGISETYEADWGGKYLAGSTRLAYDMALGSRFFVSPELTLDYFYLDQDGYSEASISGDDSLALTLASAETSRAMGAALIKLGRFTQDFRAGTELATPSARRYIAQQLYVGYRTELSAEQYSTRASFSANPGTSFDVANPYIEEDALIFGFDLNWSPEGTTVLGLGYAGELAGDYLAHRLYFELRLRW